MNANSTIHRKILLALSGLVALGLVLAPHPLYALGDLRLRTEYFINPDGSGKVKASLCGRNYDKSGKPKIRTREEVLRDFPGKKPFELEKLTQPLKFEAVKDFKFNVKTAGWVCRTFTGYFPSLNESHKESEIDFFLRYRLHREGNALRLEATWPLLEAYLVWYLVLLC